MIDKEGSIAELREIWRRGPGLHKQPSDLRRYEILIDRIKPQVVVETGLYYGASQIWFAERVPHVINVELPDSARLDDNQTTRDYKKNAHGLGWPPQNGHIVEGHSHKIYPKVAKLVKGLADGGPVMVVLDSDHGTDCVYGEMVLYRKLVTPGSYMVVEDGILHYLRQEPGNRWRGPDETDYNWFEGDPLIAAEKYLAQYDDFELDMELEDMFPTTQHPMGWLRKK